MHIFIYDICICVYVCLRIGMRQMCICAYLKYIYICTFAFMYAHIYTWVVLIHAHIHISLYTNVFKICTPIQHISSYIFNIWTYYFREVCFNVLHVKCTLLAIMKIKLFNQTKMGAVCIIQIKIPNQDEIIYEWNVMHRSKLDRWWGALRYIARYNWSINLYYISIHVKLANTDLRFSVMYDFRSCCKLYRT